MKNLNRFTSTEKKSIHNINMDSIIAGSMNACLTNLKSISHKHLKKLMVFVRDQNK